MNDNSRGKMRTSFRLFVWTLFAMIVAINPLCGQEVAQPSSERIKAVKALSVEDPAAVDIPLETQRLLDSYQISSDQLATLVKSENWQVRQKAASKFYHYEEDEASDTVAEILKPLLLDPAWQVRSSAFFALHRNKQSAESALTEIVASLNDPSEQVRGEVFDLLQRMKEKVAPAKDHLIARLKEKKQETSSELIEVLGNIGPAAKEAIPHLKKLDYSSYQIRGIALGRMQARDELMELSDSMEGMGPYAAACGFGFLKNANQAVHNRLILLASQTHSELRRDAFLSMGKIRPASKVIAEKLIEGLTDKKGYVRGAAADSLGKMEPKFDIAVEALKTASKDKDEWVRGIAADALAAYKLSPKTHVVTQLEKLMAVSAGYFETSKLEENLDQNVPVLIEIASDPESAEDLRGMAVLVFQHMENKLNEEQKKGLDDLIMRLNDDQQPITLRTAAAMDLITDEDEEKNAKFLRVIFAGVADSKLPCMRADAANKIGKFKPDGGVPILIEALADPDRDVVWWACNSLGYYKTTAADAVPELVKLIKTHEDEDVRAHAIRTIGEIRENLDLALPLIKKLIEDVRSVEHFEAVSVVPELLKNENIERAQFVEPLLKAYNAVKGHSNQVTVAMGYLGDSATPEIIGCISKGLAEKGYLRCKAAEAAGRIGEKAKSLAPELVKMLDSKDKEEVQAAIAALAKMKMNP